MKIFRDALERAYGPCALEFCAGLTQEEDAFRVYRQDSFLRLSGWHHAQAAAWTEAYALMSGSDLHQMSAASLQEGCTR